MFTFAHLSDIHIGQERGDGGARARQRAERVLGSLDELPGELDAVVLTGDVTHDGTAEEYKEAAGLLAASRHEVLLCPGNHDSRGLYRAAFLGGDPSDGSPVNQLHRLPGATFVLCDSSIPGQGAGYLDDDTLDWLDGALAGSPHDRPVFVGFHHPPVPLYAQYADGIRQFGEDRLAEVLGRHPHVSGLLCGHSHTPAVTTFAQLPLIAAPGVVSTLKMPCEDDGGSPIDYALPPMIAFHVCDDDGRLTTHFRVVL